MIDPAIIKNIARYLTLKDVEKIRIAFSYNELCMPGAT